MNKLSLIKELLLQLVARIDAGNCSMTEEDYDKVIEQIKHFSMADTKYSKYQTCKYLNMCRATFDNHVLLEIFQRDENNKGLPSCSGTRKT